MIVNGPLLNPITMGRLILTFLGPWDQCKTWTRGPAWKKPGLISRSPWPCALWRQFPALPIIKTGWDVCTWDTKFVLQIQHVNIYASSKCRLSTCWSAMMSTLAPWKSRPKSLSRSHLGNSQFTGARSNLNAVSLFLWGAVWPAGNLGVQMMMAIVMVIIIMMVMLIMIMIKIMNVKYIWFLWGAGLTSWELEGADSS